MILLCNSALLWWIGCRLWFKVQYISIVKVAPYYIIVWSYFASPQESWGVHVCCLHLKMEFRSYAKGRQWCGIIHYYWWTASIKPRLLFSIAGYASWGLSLSSVFFNICIGKIVLEFTYMYLFPVQQHRNILTTT